MRFAVGVLLPLCLSAAVGPVVVSEAPSSEALHRAGLLAMPDGSVELFFLRDGARTREIASRKSADKGRTWGEPKTVVELPGGLVPLWKPGNWNTLRPLLDRSGELHFFLMRVRQWGPRIGIDRFLDVWYLGSRQGRKRWTTPKLLWEGYVGDMRSAIELKSGRLLFPFHFHEPSRDNHPTGDAIVTAGYSDDGGDSWKISPARLTAPLDQTYRGSRHGAVEPVVIELKDGWVWMLIRTQTGRLWESFSRDGADWTEPRPSRFASSDSPAAFVRLRDGRLVVFWNNCQNAPDVDGSGVYTTRDTLSAAISPDDGLTWLGYREVYRDPRRNEPPPKTGDRGTAYPDAVGTADSKILLITGHGEGRTKVLEIDPDWLLETAQQDDFSSGIDAWSVFKHIGPAERYWRSRVQGAQRMAHPERAGAHALYLRRPPGEPSDGAVWSFPYGRKGKLTVRLKLMRGFQGASLALADRFFDPIDTAGERDALFDVRITSSGQVSTGPEIAKDTWHTFDIDWDGLKGWAVVHIDGKEAAIVPQRNRVIDGACYLRLHSLAQAPDSGFLVESVAVRVEP
ncbi:MAG: sialidase family protein [Bryobacteraceae bacterium]